jgi:hypothetical protein
MKWFRWLVPSLTLAALLTPAPAQAKKHNPDDPAAAQTAMLCNSLVYKFVLTPTEKQLVLSTMTPAEQAQFHQQLHLTDYTLSLSKMSKRKRTQYLAALPDENRNLSVQLLAALPAAQRCAEAKAPATTTGSSSGGTSNPPVNPSCTTSSTVDTNCPCNSLTVQDTRTDPTSGAKCCCSAATNPCSSDSTCSSPVEWLFLAGTGLLMGGRYLNQRRKRPAA